MDGQRDRVNTAVVEMGAAILQDICDKALDELGSTVPPTQLRALLVVDSFGGMNMNRLAQEMRTSLSATSRLCDRLQAAGLIVRSAGKRDRREVLISLSRAGGRLVEWAREQRRTALERIIDAMSPAGREALVRGLNELRDAARQTP